MPATVSLQLVHGNIGREAFSFDRRTTFLLGRGRDCGFRMPVKEVEYQVISRYHCMFDINPPFIQIRDLGSLNGTYVNGRRLAAREAKENGERSAAYLPLERVLRDGDEVRIGPAVFRVMIDGGEDGKPAEACAWCGRPVSLDSDVPWPGDRVCTACREQPRDMLSRLLDESRKGGTDLSVLSSYALVDERDRGALGATFLARREDTGEPVMMKLMIPRVPLDPHRKGWLCREVDGVRKLDHPNILKILDYVCVRGVFVFLLEHCEGGSVDELIFQIGGAFPAEEAVAIVSQVLDALEYAHGISRSSGAGASDAQVGLSHRDLTPSSIFMSDPGYVARICGFGLKAAFVSTGLSGALRTGFVGPKPVFMCRRQLVDFHSRGPVLDVWGAAACLYAMLTGHFPRDFPRDKDPLASLLQSGPVPVGERDPSISPQLARVIDIALEDRGEAKFKSAAQFKQALEGAL